MDSTNPFDPSAIQRLRRLGDETFVRSMIELFFSFVAEKLTEARRAREGGDLTRLGDAAHAIKSTAANAGASRVSETARLLEQRSKEGDADQAQALLTQLEQAFQEVTPYLEAEKPKLGGAGG